MSDNHRYVKDDNPDGGFLDAVLEGMLPGGHGAFTVSREANNVVVIDFDGDYYEPVKLRLTVEVVTEAVNAR